MRIEAAEEAMKEHRPKLGEKGFKKYEPHRFKDNEYIEEKTQELYDEGNGEKTLEACRQEVLDVFKLIEDNDPKTKTDW